MNKSEMGIILRAFAFLSTCECGAAWQFIFAFEIEIDDLLDDYFEESFSTTDDEDLARLKAKEFAKSFREMVNATRSKSEIYRNNVKKRYIHSKIVKKLQNNPDKLLEYVERHGTKVNKIIKADKILALINETEGFITPKKGLKALYLNFVINKKISFNFEECFVLRNLPLDPYYTIHQFYTWYAFKAGFAGYEYETQEKFNALINSLFDK